MRGRTFLGRRSQAQRSGKVQSSTGRFAERRERRQPGAEPGSAGRERKAARSVR
jgi:hypothetical protein